MASQQPGRRIEKEGKARPPSKPGSAGNRTRFRARRMSKKTRIAPILNAKLKGNNSNAGMKSCTLIRSQSTRDGRLFKWEVYPAHRIPACAKRYRSGLLKANSCPPSDSTL